MSLISPHLLPCSQLIPHPRPFSTLLSMSIDYAYMYMSSLVQFFPSPSLFFIKAQLLLLPSLNQPSFMERRYIAICQTFVKRCYIFSSKVEIIVLSLTGYEMFEQFTSLTLSLVTCKMKTVTESVFTLSGFHSINIYWVPTTSVVLYIYHFM